MAHADAGAGRRCMPAMTEKRVALITGCGKANGIGGAIARALAAAGTIVVATDIARAGAQNDNSVESANLGWRGLESLVDDIKARGGAASWLTGDVSSEADAGRMVGETLERHGRLDILVNNAGAPHGADRGEIETVSLEAWERVLAVNTRGPFLMMRAAVPAMKARRWGRIISVASVAGLHPLPQRGAYSASKAAVLGLTRSVAYDLAPLGITVNAVCPGSIRTDRAISTTLRAGYTDVEAGLSDRAKHIPARRHGLPDEVAALVGYLASDAGAFVTGQALVIDGGGLPPHAV